MFDWTGRFDGQEEEYHRIFQRVKNENDYSKIKTNDFVLHGFCVDEGVKRNKGRIGAATAPDVIRKNTSNFPIQNSTFNLLDFGNIYCTDGNLEEAQTELSEKVKNILVNQGRSIVFGGGHEVTFAHYSGIKKAFPDKKIGIINFDAHFDNREPVDGLATSGTGFWQIAQEGHINSLHIGIQKNSNTRKLFETADHYGMNYILAEELYSDNIPLLKTKLEEFIDSVDVLYTTICMDVFNASIAPGVSALAYNGIFADHTFMQIYHTILNSKKLKALDVAEVNPLYDIQQKTARLASCLINEWFMI